MSRLGISCRAMEERSGTLRRVVAGDRARRWRSAVCWHRPPSRPRSPKKVKDTTTWLCKPGIPDNPCEPGFDTTLFSPIRPDRGTQSVKPTRSGSSTASTSIRRSATTRAPTRISRSTPRSARSRSTRPRATPALPRLRADVPPVHPAGALRRRGSRRRSCRSPTATCSHAWQTYLRKYNQGRGVVLIGHSQGTFVLRQLIAPGHRPEASGAASGWSRRSCSAAT